MKLTRIFSVILCLVLLLSAAGCGNSPEQIPPESPTSGTHVQPTQSTQQQTEPETLLIPHIPAQDQLVSADPKTAREWVFTNYDQTIGWRDPDGQYHSMTLVLPALTPAAEFAVSYNLSVAQQGEMILDEVRASYEKGYYLSTVSLTYQATEAQDILFVILDRRMTEGYSMYNVDAFDLQERRQLHMGDVTEELLDMDYPTFILAVTELVKQEFIRIYEPIIRQLEEETYTGPDSYLASAPDKAVENYYGILERFPYLTLYLSQSRLFADENGDLYLTVCTPDAEGLKSVRQVIPFDITALNWDETPTQEQAYGHLLDIQHYVDGIHTEAYGIMLTEAFFSDPEDFVKYAAVESKDSIELIVCLLKYSLYGEQIEAFILECDELLQEADLTEKERTFVNAALEENK